MPRSWYWLAGRPPPACIPEDRTVQFDDGPPTDNTGGDGQTTSGDTDGSRLRASVRRNLFALLESLLGTDSVLGTGSPSGGVVTEADASKEPSELGSAAEADPAVPVQVPTEVPPTVEPNDEPEGEPEGGPAPENVPENYPDHEPFWSTFPLRCEGCLCLPPPTYEIGLEPWREGLPRSHEYALLNDEHGAGLPCFSHEVRASVRWHLDHPGQRPRTTRWWCLACNYQNDQERYDFVQNWSWRNRQMGNGIHYRTVEEYAVNQFHWPRHVEFPPAELATMVWPEADETLS